ncbi:MAG: hypothetical protein GTO00_09120 [Deltaproteobacteria bacterium]|nr:hypothetical protein [Deltaproteobacteria bacterium]
MLRDNAVSLIQQGLGFRSDLSTQIITMMQYVQEDVLEERPTLPWFLLEEFSEAETTANEERLLLPADFLGEYEEGTLWLYTPTADPGDQWQDIPKDFLDNIKTGETGSPEAYALTNKYFRLAPIPDAVYKIKMVYYKKGQSLATNIENEWLANAGDLLINLTGQYMAEDVGNDKALAKFNARVVTAEDRFFRENEERKHTNMRYIIGGED